jgi:hypothetical protein
MDHKTAPYGSWKSPITTDLVFGSYIGLEGTQLDGREIYWTEMRPNEGGRSVIVRRTPDGQNQDVTPPVTCRTRSTNTAAQFYRH